MGGLPLYGRFDMEEREHSSAGVTPFQVALERHLLSCGCGAGEPQDGHDCQREASCKTVTFHVIFPFGLRYNGETSFPARRPSAGAMPGR